MPVMMSHYVMLQRNLIYTGITRAKKILVLVGTKKALSSAVHHVTVDERNTCLKERLRRLLPTFESVSQDTIRNTAGLYLFPENPQSLNLVAEEADYGKQDKKPSHEEWLKIDLFERLAKSEFRSRFRLSDNDKEYISEKGMETIREHARDFVAKRLAPENPANDGKQTPMRGHPVFIAQHATGTCCRGCLEKWHGIPKGRELSEAEQEYVVDVLMKWVRGHVI